MTEDQVLLTLVLIFSMSFLALAIGLTVGALMLCHTVAGWLNALVKP